MMNISKHADFFNPQEDLKDPIHIIGCGAIGSVLAENLTRLGIEHLHLYDFDIVDEHNITNQLYTHGDLYKLKLQALEEKLMEINPEAKPFLHYDGWTKGIPLKGFVFLGVDSIDLRRTIIQENIVNMEIKAFFDFRMRLTDAQHYAALNNPKEIKKLLATMNFSDEEAKKETPVSACNTTLSISPTIRSVVAFGVSNFLNFLKGNPLRHTILFDAFSYVLDVYE